MRQAPRYSRPKYRKCQFCENKTLPNINEVEILKNYISERGKILAHLKSGVCAKHQRRLTKIIKHARLLGLISFTNRVY